MSKYSLPELWKKRYGSKTEVVDYAGRLMKISAHTNPSSAYQPTLDHVRPLCEKHGGKDVEENIEICNRKTNAEKGDLFPHWSTNNRSFRARKRKGTSHGYWIEEITDEI